MTHEERAAYITAQTALFHCILMGMTAENVNCNSEGQPLTHGEDAFKKVYAEWEHTLGHSALMTFFKD